MCLTVMASNPKPPCLFSLDETVFMCTNDDDPPRLDDSDDLVDVSNVKIQKHIRNSNIIYYYMATTLLAGLIRIRIALWRHLQNERYQ